MQELVTLTELPTMWEVFLGRKVAILLDLSTSPFKYEDWAGKPLSMAAIIKNKVCNNIVAFGLIFNMISSV